METKAETEVEKVEKLMKEATDKINNLDKIVDSKIEKILKEYNLEIRVNNNKIYYF